jgi:hypothetical protein
VKRSELDSGTQYSLFGNNGSSNDTFGLIAFFGNNIIIGGFTLNYLVTSAVYRDPSAWTHIVVAMNTTQATASNRLKVYVNGSEVTAFSTDNRSSISQNSDQGINQAVSHAIGRQDTGSGSSYFSGYLADIHFIDGQALDPTSFGEFDTNGIWQPLAYSGTYGTNGFHLDFSNNASAAALGTDTSGNGNTWTVNNLSVTAGAGNDSLVDVPTNGSEVDTGSGGQVRGNYCTANPLAANGGATFSNGNLDVATPTDNNGIHICTIGITSGKWYWESTITNANPYAAFGITKEGYSIASGGAGILGASSTAYAYMENGQKYNNSSASAYGNTFTTNDVIGVAFDADAGSLFFYKNGVAQNSGTAAFTGLTSGPYFPAASDRNTSTSTTIVHNFGARSFAYTAPSGFKALCTANLPAPVVTKPSTVMDVALWTGNGSTQSITTDFSPDFVWIKSRSASGSHNLFDAVRGATNLLETQNTDPETTNATTTLTSFNSNGFSLSSSTRVNGNGTTYVGWCFDAGSSTVTNTAGSISSQVRTNNYLSIVTYTGTGSNATVGHGLGVQPGMIIIKARSNGTEYWFVWHKSLATNYQLALNTTGAAVDGGTSRFTSAPSSSLLNLGTDAQTNGNGTTYVCYAFAPVAGYSSMGSYVANGTSDNAFCYTGFRPRFLLLKASSTTGSWLMVDSARASYNLVTSYLLANASDAEGTADSVDFLSNGFKVRTSIGGIGVNGNTVIWAAFAESPFQYARAR